MISRLFVLLSITAVLVACAAAPEREPVSPQPHDRLASDFSTPEAALNYYMLIGEIALSRGEYADAADAYLAAMSLTDDPAIAERAAHLALHTDRPDEAWRAAQRWRELEPDASGPLEAETLAALRRGDLDAADGRIDALLARWDVPGDTGQRDAFAALGRLLIDEPDLEPALALMRRITARHDVAAAWQVTGTLALRADDVALARRAAKRARELEPESTQAAILEARVHTLTGEPERGLDLMRALVAEHPRDPALRFTLAGMYLHLRAYDEARDELEQVVAQVPSYMDARWTLAMLLLQQEEPDAAEPHIRALLADPARRWDAPYYLGGVYEMRGDWATALEWFDQVEWGDNLMNARLKAAHMLFMLDRRDEAGARLQQVRDDFPEQRARTYRAEAELLVREGSHEQALAVYERALARMPDDTRLLYGRALHLEEMGRYDEAIADLRRIHELEPDSAEAQNALGYVMADRGPPESWPEARDLIAQALAQEPDNAAYIDSMGWVLYRLGRLDQAREWLERAWDLMPDAEIGAHLGEVLWKLGRTDDARAIWEQAARVQADHPVLVETVERLAN